jgi:hypothetical protein
MKDDKISRQYARGKFAAYIARVFIRLFTAILRPAARQFELALAQISDRVSTYVELLHIGQVFPLAWDVVSPLVSPFFKFRLRICRRISERFVILYRGCIS